MGRRGTIKPSCTDKSHMNDLGTYYADTWRQMSDACTRCGKCVEVCPLLPFAPGLSGANPQDVITGLMNFMDGADLPENSGTWAKQCNGCEKCVPACPENVNPRRLIMMANSRISKVEQPTPNAFRRMVRAAKIMVSMQLIPERASRMLRPPKGRPVDVIFYGGCNPIRTPHLLFNGMTLLDEIGVEYEFIGGSSACCGIVHTKWEGELDRGGKVSEITLRKFGDFTPSKVLSWCPSCHIHLSETIKGYRRVEFEFGHITKFLFERKADLIPRLTHPVPKRVLMHTHTGMNEVGQHIVELLKHVPGLEIVEEFEEPGYMCGASGSEKSPELKAHVRKQTIERCKQLNVDAVISMYHACHRQLLVDGKKHGFEVLNFTDILVMATGKVPCKDTLEPFLGRSDWENIVREALPMLESNGLDIDPQFLEEMMPEILGSAEWKGGLCRFDEITN